MELYHVTTPENADAIMRGGFAISHVRDSQGSSWFSASFQSTFTASSGGALIVVDIPEGEAEQYRYRFPEEEEAYLDNYVIPFAVVNRYRPFRCMPAP